MAALFISVLSLILVPAVADLDFGKAAQNMVDKIQSGDKSLPVLKELSPQVKANLLRPPEKVKTMTARDPMKALPKAKEMPKAFDDFPKIDFEKPLNKSILSKDLEKIVDKDRARENKRLKSALARLSQIYEKRVGPDGFALVGKPLQRLNEKEDVPLLWNPSSISLTGLCAFVGLSLLGFGLIVLRWTRQGSDRLSVVSDSEELEDPLETAP